MKSFDYVPERCVIGLNWHTAFITVFVQNIFAVNISISNGYHDVTFFLFGYKITADKIH